MLALYSVHYKRFQPGVDLGFSEGGVRIRGGSRREELTLVLYFRSRGSGVFDLFSTKIPDTVF